MRARQASLNRAARCRVLHDGIATRARQLGTAVANHPEVRTHVFELFGNILAQRLEMATALRAILSVGHVDALFTLQVFR
ncbi:hypothetical protein PSP31121_05524 [Pandoraea sputorum]|uniref:Uncharacterized protein n=1 Tax=Pandoraea sputorum TaxID=93222 RepID=A0A5E5BI47_9BURK|nr:hypothetical protein PSP31121_05524 [Pandoraea sputorum]